MRVGTGRRWFERPPERHGASVLVSLAVTFALFVAAFGSMRSVGRWSADGPRAPRDAAPIIHLQTPAEPVTPRTPPASAVGTTRASRAEPMTPPAPTSTSRSLDTPPPVAAPAAGFPTTTDTGVGIARPAVSPAGIPAATMRGGRGAPVGPAGVTIGSRTANTAFFRDSVAHARAALVPQLSRNHPATGVERAEIQQSQRVADRLARRVTTAGNSAGVVVLTGEGLGGVGAVGGGDGKAGGAIMSVGAPLFSSGPSTAQRRINERIDAEYQLRLRALQDRVNLKRETARLDSLRRDSLRRVSLRRDSLDRDTLARARRPDRRE